MRNEEKAKRIALNKQSGKNNGFLETYLIAYDSAMDMAEWKEQEIIERASLFFIDFFKELPDGPNKFKIKRDCSTEQLIEEFTKAIKD